MASSLPHFSAVLLALISAVIGASPADWMPAPHERCQLVWAEAAPRAFQQPAPASEVLCFHYGGNDLRFDTAGIRPITGSWECSVLAEGRRFVCRSAMKTDDPFHLPTRVVEAGRHFQRVA
jgi:hypothetical protein